MTIVGCPFLHDADAVKVCEDGRMTFRCSDGRVFKCRFWSDIDARCKVEFALSEFIYVARMLHSALNSKEGQACLTKFFTSSPSREQ